MELGRLAISLPAPFLPARACVELGRRAETEWGYPAIWLAETGQDLGNLSTGYNDVGLIVAPDGHRYAVAVMIASTRRPIPARMQLMGDVTRAVVASHADRTR